MPPCRHSAKSTATRSWSRPSAAATSCTTATPPRRRCSPSDWRRGSLLVECAGLGASVLPAAPALWPLLGVDELQARQIVDATREITLAEHPRYRVPVLGDAGAPVGVDLRRVLETGTRPVIDIVM